MELLEQKSSVKGPADRFTGDVWVDMLVDDELPSRLREGVVRFSPGARTAWHRHTSGQTLHVNDGIGLAQTREGDVVVMHPGDTVHTPADEWHWHGVTPERFMTHLSMADGSDDPAMDDVEWGEAVTNDAYQLVAGSVSNGGDAQ
jgi:quercetin dioxygenase-like cupin family protein